MPDMQTKLAEWKQAEKECKCGCTRQHKGQGPLSCLFGHRVEESLVLLNMGKGGKSCYLKVLLSTSIRLGAWGCDLEEYFYSTKTALY